MSVSEPFSEPATAHSFSTPTPAGQSKAQSAKTRPTKTQAAKTQAAKTQAAKTQTAKPESIEEARQAAMRLVELLDDTGAAGAILGPRENQLLAVLEDFCGPKTDATESATARSGKPRLGKAVVDKGSAVVTLTSVRTNLPLYERPAEALRLATEAFAETGYWIAFYKAVLGPEGIVAKLFPKIPELDYFHTTPQFREIMKSLTAIRTSDFENVTAIESQKMLTIRIPKTMAEALEKEAKRFNTSVNKLAISKLLMPIQPDCVPVELQKVKGQGKNKRKKIK